MKVFSSKEFDEDGPYLIDNPLRDLGPPELQTQADAFAKLVATEPPSSSLVRSFKTLAYWANLSRQPLLAQDTDSDDDDDPHGTDEALLRLFRKAAAVAQNPFKLDRLVQSGSISKHEKARLERDREVRFWNQPKPLRVTVVTLCFSAIIQGWIQSGGNGANQNWPQEFGLTNLADGTWTSSNAKWIFAGVNAIPYFAASIFGCWASDPLQSMVLGRRGAIFVSGLLCFASLIGSACARNWKQLMVCRALVGLGMGAKASVTPIFGAETSPSHLRGALVMNWQLFDAFGILLGFTANLVLLNADTNLGWRLQFAAACVPTACLLTLIWTIPESPRWLLKQRRHREAFKALCSLRETELQAATELFYANAQLQIEAQMQPQKIEDSEKEAQSHHAQHIESIHPDRALNQFQDSSAMTNFFSRILQLFRNPRTRRATIAASVVMISQQLCGINVIMFYSSTFFRDTSGLLSSSADQNRHQAVKALWLSWGVGLFNFIFTFPAYFAIDTKGRRFLLFCTYPGMILSMLAACLSFLDPNDVNVKVAIFMFIFVFFYSWGQGPVAFAYSSEVFPLINREAGMSFAVFINLLGAGLLTLFVPLAQTTETANPLAPEFNVGQARLLGIFVAFNVLAAVLIFFLVPETAGATIRRREDDDHLSYMKLEELNYIFNVSTRKHMDYQVRHMLPYVGGMIRWWLCKWFTNRYSRPPAPKKMWLWVEMGGLDSEDEKMVDSSESSGSDQAREEETSARMSQRNNVQVVGK